MNLTNYQLIAYNKLEGERMEDRYCASIEEVKLFLYTLKNILKDPKFNIDRDFDILLKKKNEETSNSYTTMNTLLELEYGIEDVIEELLTLEIYDYKETLIDDKGENLPKFYVFIKDIKGKDVYIKIKIRNINNRKVFCISFHFAKYKFSKFPYKRGENNEEL